MMDRFKTALFGARRSALALGFALLLACCAGEDAPAILVPDDVTVRTIAQGELIGAVTPQGAHAWLGIPYAAAPTGDLRWRAPREAAPWKGRLEALDPTHRCLQYATDTDPGFEAGELAGSEDCLFLNVWAPPGPVDGLPVMVWIHGGGNVWGFGGQLDPSRLVLSQNVVVVAPNYRLGPMGWFSHSALRDGAERPEDRSANFGLLDLIAALRWTKDNIAEFGGDPSRVTIFGESAGAFNVGALLASPLSEGLFNGAIMQSGGFASHTMKEAEFGPETQEERRGFAAREALGQLGIAEPKQTAVALRAIPAPDLFAAYRDLRPEEGSLGDGIDPIDITADGIVVPEDGLPALLAREDGLHDVPVIFGTNRDETRAAGMFDDHFTRSIGGVTFFAKDKDAYLAQGAYPSATWFERAVARPADLRSAAGSSPVFTYRFEWDEEGKAAVSDLAFLVGASHTIEVAFVIGDFDSPYTDPFGFFFTDGNEDQRLELSARMMAYWGNFAHTGDPGKGPSTVGSPWQAWSGDARKTMVFDTEATNGTRMMRYTGSMKSLTERFIADDRFRDDIDRCKTARLAADTAISTGVTPGPWRAFVIRFCPSPGEQA
ncbi:carboxylesterase family protein [Citromicrobium bathyomarinum]